MQAEQAASESWSYMRSLRDKKGMAASLEVMAKCQTKRGDFHNAIQKLEEAAFIYRDVADVYMEARILISMAAVRLADTSKKTDEEKMLPIQHSMTAVELLKELGELGEDGHIQALLMAARAYNNFDPQSE